MKKDNFTSIPFPPRRLSLGSEWARPYPILGILQERSGAPELLLAWTDPDVVRRVTITFPLLLVDTTLPATVGTETCRWDGLSTPYQAKPFSVFPTPAVHGRRLSSSFEHLHQNSARLSPRKKNLSPTKDTTPTGSPIAICSITMRSLHLSTGSAHRHPHPHSGAEGRAPEKDNFLVWLLRWHPGRLARLSRALDSGHCTGLKTVKVDSAERKRQSRPWDGPLSGSCTSEKGLGFSGGPSTVAKRYFVILGFDRRPGWLDD